MALYDPMSHLIITENGHF